jgi:hypothetical protein
MNEIEIAKSQANSRKERLKSLAVAGGESMFIAFCSTIGMFLATALMESVRNRTDRKS